MSCEHCSEGELRKVVEVHSLCYAYPDGHQAIRGISFDIYAGETVALIGPNGAGKSTLLLHLNGVLRNGHGAVRVLDLSVEDRHLKQIRGKVGLVFQDPEDQLFSATVFDDVAFGPLNLGLPVEGVRARVQRALALVGLEGFEQRSPHHLSTGEKKRVAIATVLSMDPEILVLDEPTSNLDPRRRWELIMLLQQLPLTKVIASHDLEMVRVLCDRAILLDRGQVAADGQTLDILSNLPLLASHGLAPPLDHVAPQRSMNP